MSNNFFWMHYKSSGLTAAAFADKCGITAAQLKNYIIGRTKAPPNKMERAKDIAEKVKQI